MLDARYSPVTGTTYDNIGDRMEEGETRLDAMESSTPILMQMENMQGESQ